MSDCQASACWGPCHGTEADRRVDQPADGGEALLALLQAAPPGSLPPLPEGDPAFVHSSLKKRAALERWRDLDEQTAPLQAECDECKGIRWGGQRVDCCSCDRLSYDGFVSEYMAPNKPVLIRGVATKWAASRDWVDADGGVAMTRLAERYGSATVQVTTMPVGDPCVDDSWRCEEMSLAAYADWWRRWHAADPSAGHAPKYLKDWHFVNEFGEHFQAYTLPTFFSEDWLNGFYDRVASESGAETVASDYRFVYCGPRGSWTPLHADVLRSYSWSANVVGRKRWLLLPPEQTFRLYDAPGMRMASSFRPEDLCDSAPQFPLLESAAQYVTEVIQMPGDALFVPSGWHHMVENMDDCLSINHNWLNQYNVQWTLAFLEHGYAEAVKSIEDCRELCASVEEFEQLVQRNLSANCGLDAAQLLRLLSCAAEAQSDNDGADDADASFTSEEVRRLAKDICLGRIRGCLAALSLPPTGSSTEAIGADCCTLATSIERLPETRNLRERLADICFHQEQAELSK